MSRRTGSAPPICRSYIRPGTTVSILVFAGKVCGGIEIHPSSGAIEGESERSAHRFNRPRMSLLIPGRLCSQRAWRMGMV